MNRFAPQNLWHRLVPVAACLMMLPQALFSRPVAADLTVVGTLSVQQTSPIVPSDPDRTITVYSHAKQARTEIDGGRTVLFNGGDVYVLDNRAKTYYKTTLKTWNGQPQPVLQDVASVVKSDKIDVDSGVDLSEADDSAGPSKQTLVGLDSRKYTLSGWINVSPAPQDNYQPPSTHRPTRPGGDSDNNFPVPGSDSNGFPNAFRTDSKPNSLLHTVQNDIPNPANPGKFGLIRSTVITGDIWLSKADNFTDDKSNTVWAQALVSSWGVGTLCGNIAGRIAKEHALPLSAQLNFAWIRKPLPTDDDPYEGEVIDEGRHTRVHMSFTVTSISDNPVDPSLFAIPSGYTLVSTRYNGLPPGDASNQQNSNTLQ